VARSVEEAEKQARGESVGRAAAEEADDAHDAEVPADPYAPDAQPDVP
jgi:hypothetical protein